MLTCDKRGGDIISVSTQLTFQTAFMLVMFTDAERGQCKSRSPECYMTPTMPNTLKNLFGFHIGN